MRPHRGPIALICITAIGLATLISPVADASSRGHHGSSGIIAFQRFDEAGWWQIWTANADLTNQRQLTSGDHNSGWATWKPDGTRVAFDSDRSDPDPTDDVGANDVYTTKPDGTGVVQVTNFAGGFSGDPSWSPDGKWLTYQSDLGDYPVQQGIYISRPDGSRLHRVTTLPEGYGFDAAARFSPNGEQLVFTRYRFDDEGVETSALYVVNVKGAGERVLAATANLHPNDAAWSPDGRTIVFEAYGPDPLNFGNIFTIGVDGKHLRNLTNNDTEHEGSADPVYSPDGRQIMYLKGENINADTDPVIGLATMKKNGQGAAFVSDTPSFATQEHQPDWIQAPRIGHGHRKAPAPASTRQAAPRNTFSERRDIYRHLR